MFHGELDAIIPFIVYHLSLGMSHITVYYSNGEAAVSALPTWSNHPALSCLRRNGLLSIVERSTIHVRSRSAVGSGLNDDAVVHVYGDHCFSADHLSNWKHGGQQGTAAVVWGVVLGLHDMVVLHHLQCIDELLYNVSSASLALRTFSFLPDEGESILHCTALILHYTIIIYILQNTIYYTTLILYFLLHPH